jgi:type VI protein secretion system component VasF
MTLYVLAFVGAVVALVVLLAIGVLLWHASETTTWRPPRLEQPGKVRERIHP